MAAVRGLGKRAATVEAECEVFRKYLEQFAFLPILNGQLVDCFIPNGSSFAVVRHSLGRAYVGGLIAGLSSGAVNVQTPEAAAAAVDITKYFVVGWNSALTADTNIRVWLF